MLTAIRGDQIQMDQIHNGHIVGPTNTKFGSGIHHEKLYLDNSIVAGFLNEDESVHRAVLDSRLIALWDVATSQSVSGTSIDVTTVINSTATAENYQGVNADGTAESGNPIAVMGATEKGVLTTGTGSAGAGISNYKIQIRDASTKDPIHDDLGGRVYGELTNDSIGTDIGNYTLAFKKSDGTDYTMAVAEASTITAIADKLVENLATGQDSPTYTHSLNGKYFHISSPTTNYYVWYNVSGEAAIDPASENVGRTGLAVTIAPESTATEVAATTATVLTSQADFSASSSLETITITNTNAGVPLEVLSDGVGGKETGFGFIVATPGSPTMVDFMFMEVFSYLTAPTMSFTNGVGFADIVGVAGSHNHHDLYYTKIELESGQLDNRYYTKSQMDSGQLDNRYYTESEVDPNPGSDTGDAKLDTRYYKESEISSSAAGSSGAKLVGVAPSGNLSSANVQDALVELQSDVDGILDGSIDISFSLDEAYDDGSVVAVDDTNVDWQLTDTKSFKISSDAGITDLVNVTANAAGDSVDINANRVDISATADSHFDVTDADVSLRTITSGNVNITAADTVDIDGSAFDIDATGASAITTTNANLTVETATSGTLTVRSAGSLNVKDQFLGAALPLSQTGVTGLSVNLDTGVSIIGAINENTDDLYTLINTTLPATTDGASGADQIGATGITGIIPTGGTLGSDATVQAMLEGIAKGAAGSKVFPSLGTAADGTETGDPVGPGSLLAEKATGMYFKANEIVYIKDKNRFVIIKVQGTNTVEGTDWDYLWGANEVMGGPAFNVSVDSITMETTGTTSIISDSGIVLIEDSGAKIELTAAGTVDIDAATGHAIAAYSDTEIELNGGALVDIDGTAITMDGQLTATGAADDNMVIQTSGTGEVQLISANEIDLTGGAIDINAGTGYAITIDSDTSIAATAPVVDINGATSVDIDGTAINTTGVLTQTGDTQIIGAMNLDGAIDHDGTSFNSSVDTFTVAAANNVDIDSAAVAIDATGAVSIDAGAASNISTSVGDLVVSAAGTLDMDAASIDMDATGSATIDAADVTATAAQDGNIQLQTSGTGIIRALSDVKFDIEAPLVDAHGDVVIESNHQLYVDKINITSVDPADYATITGTRGGELNTNNLIINSGFEAGSGADADNWTETSANSARTDAEQFYNAFSLRYKDPATATTGTEELVVQTISSGVTDGNAYRLSMYVKGINQAAIQASLGGGTPIVMVAANANPIAWTRYEAVVTAGSSNEDLSIFVSNAGGEESDFFIDAVMLEGAETGESGENAATSYFTSYFSNLVFTVGDEDDDQIIFRSEGTAKRDLVKISQNDVFIDGNLTVTGDTTSINTTELLVEDNEVILNSTVTGTPNLDAFLTVERGDDENAQLKWNETTDKWELYNNATSQFENIVTSASDVGISMDAAYNGGSEVSVDNTNVVFTLDTGKSFQIGDAADTSKFVVTQGTAANSIALQTSGGLDVDVDAGFNFLDTSSGYTLSSSNNDALFGLIQSGVEGSGDSIYGLAMNGNDVILSGAAGTAYVNAYQIDIGSSTTNNAINLSTRGTINFNIGNTDTTAQMNSTNIQMASEGLSFSSTVGIVEVDAATTFDVDAATSVTVDAPAINTTGVLTQTGDAQIIGNLNLDGNFDQSGNYTFLVNTAATAADAVSITSAGGADLVVASDLDIAATNINTTGVLTQTGDAQIIGNMNFDGSIDADGADINIAASGTGGTHLAFSSADAASITSVGLTLEAGTGALVAEADAASSINVTGAGLTLGTTTSGTVALTSAGAVTFDDANQTNPINFSQTAADGFATEFAYNAQTDFDWSVRDTGTDAITSIMGALNANRQDIYEFVELLSTQGAAVGTAAGANLIGVDGITGVVPMDEGFNPVAAVGADATLQEILNGIATSAGGGKTYANIAAFTAAKAASTYYKLGEHVRILDTNRLVIVHTANTNTVEGTDWDYVYGSARPLGGAEYFVDTTSAINLSTVDFDIVATTFDIAASSAVLVDGESTVTVDAADNIVLTSGTTMDMDAVTFDIDGTTFDADLTGAFTVDANAGSHVNVTTGSLTLSTQTSGDINLSSVGNIVESAITKEENITTFDVNASGAFTIDGAASSFLRTTGANLNFQTVGSGELMFKDAGMTAALPLSDAANRSLDKDPDAAAVASIFDAINRAYNNTGDTSKKTYMEAPSLTSTDVANGYIQVSDEAGLFTGLASGTSDEAVDLPGGATNISITAGQLRSTYGIFLAVYLNGLRLSDSEWVYIYDQATGRKVISFVNDHSTHPEFSWSTVNAVDAITLSVTDHIVFDCTFNKSSNT